MTPERYQRIADLFAAACERGTVDRAVLLNEACEGDDELRAAVEAMLAHDVADAAFPSTEAGPGAIIAALARETEHEQTEALPASIGRYRIRRVLGEGGMGVVYLAQQDYPQRPVALKVVRPGLISGAVQRRFQNEADILGRLQHPGIAQIYEAGTGELRWSDDGGAHPARRVPFFAMEFVRGEPLLAYAARRGLDVRQRLAIVAKICEAVQHAHRQGVIHRDLKPANILIQEDPAENGSPESTAGSDGVMRSFFAPQPKVLDFGVARITNSDMQATTVHTDIGQLIGTLPYMSPEQVAGDPSQLDERADVYALGVILYQLLTDRLPFDVRNRSIPEAIRIIREHEPTRLSSIHTFLRGDIENIVAKCLEKERPRRYASAADLAADIERYLQHRPLLARPASRLYNLRKFARRNRGLVGGIVAAFVFLSAGLAATLYWAVREARQRERAEHQTLEARRQAYQANIAAAQSALQNIDVYGARRNLDAAPAELRGWEWNHLNWVADRSLLTIAGRPGDGNYLTASHDGKMVACGGMAGEIQLRRLSDGELTRTIAAHSVRIDGLAFSSNDQLLASTAGGEMSVWETSTGERLWTRAGAARVIDGSFSPDGAVVAVGLLSTYCIGLFDAKTGREVGRIPLGDTVVAAAMFSPDGAYLACDVDLHVALLDARTHTPLWTVDGWPGMFSPDGKSLTLWSSWRGPVNFYEVESGRLLSSHGGLTSEVAAWTLCDHGARLVTHEANGAVVLRDVTDGTATATICAPQCPSNRGIAAGADRIVTTAADGGLTFWDTRIPSVPWVVPTFFQVFSSAISATGSVLVSGGWGEVTRYDVDTGAPLWSSLVSRGSIRVLAISPDDRYIAATGEKHDLILIDANTGARVYTVPLGPAEVRALAWSPDGKRIFAGGDGKNLEIRSTQNGEVVAKLPGQRGPIRGIAVSPDGLKLVSVSGTSGASEGALQIWDLQSNRLLHDVRDHGPAMTCVAYNADGTQIAVGSEDLTVTLWSSSGEKLATLSGTSGIPTSVRFGPAKTRDEKARVLASTQDGKIHVWNSSTADEILTLRASSRQLFAAAISPDEHVLLAGGETIAVLAFETKPPVSGNGGRDHVRSARKWMEAAVHELDLAEDVVQRLEEQPDLPDDMRRTAMQFARVRGDHVNWLNSESWGIVARTNASQEVYQRARRISARACELWPDDYALLNTRGIAEYRAADYPAALATLQRCDTMGQALRGSSQPEDVIFLAMTHAQRGEIAEARHQLERAERIVMERPDRGGSECQNFLREAQELITALH